MAAPTWSFGVDWSGDGDFSDTGEAITRVLDGVGITVQYGRDNARSTAPSGPGQADLTLNNQSGDYSPDKATGPLYGSLGPGRAVRLQAVHNATTYDVFRGVIDAYDLAVDPPSRTVRLGLVDAVSQLAAVQVSTGLYPGLRTDQAIAVVLDEAGWSATARDLDTGATMVQWWWADGVTAWEAIQALVDSEGPGALATVDATGNFVFRSRHHRILRTAAITSQATFRSTGAEPRISALDYDAGWRDVVNVVSLTVETRQAAADGAVVWTSDDSWTIEDGETIHVAAQPDDPVYGAAVPVEDTDYRVSGAVDVSLDRTSGQTITISIMATGGPAVLTGLQLRAVPVPVVRTVEVIQADNSSIAKYGRRTWSGTAPWAGYWDAQAIATLLLATRAERLPTVTITIRGGNDTRLTQQLSRDLSDRITVVNADTGLNGDFWIGRIEHTVALAGRFLETQFFCEKAPSIETSVLRFDTAGHGFDDGRFGAGFDDPAAIFIFDGTSGHRFSEGNFAT